ncbi:DUF596 domain-containing protein [Cupriavidus sp. DL-D2]|uniref:DUF596 domain-containing protein n=1 Tax=Cupriavidus sp. DL-D2 TaxID=3144974 RepID=UPI0032135C4B
MKNDELIERVRRSAFGLSMGAIWQHMTVGLESEGICVDRTAMFFSILRSLMSAGVVRLGSGGIMLAGSEEDQLALLRPSWPTEPNEDDLDGFGMWFLTDAPAGVVWVDANGAEVWT